MIIKDRFPFSGDRHKEEWEMKMKNVKNIMRLSHFLRKFAMT